MRISTGEKEGEASGRLMGQDRRRARAEGKKTSNYEKIITVRERGKKKTTKKSRDKRDTKTERREQGRESSADKNRSRKALSII